MAAPPRRVVMLTLDFPEVLRFFGSVALAVAVQQHTSVEWRSYNDSKVLNAMYTVFFWKEKPGSVEVEQDWNKIRMKRDELWSKYLGVFLKKISESPRSGLEYAEQMEKLKTSTLESTRSVFGEVARINAEIAGDIAKTVKTLAAVKAGSVIFIAATTGGLAIVGSGLAASASTIGCVTSISLSVAKNMQEAKQAEVVAVDIGTDAGKALGGNYVAQPLGEGMVRWLATRPGVIEAATRIGLFKNATGAIEEYSRQLANAKTAAKKAKLQGRIDARQGVRRAGMAKAARGIPVIFAINDIIGAVQEYQSDTAGL